MSHCFDGITINLLSGKQCGEDGSNRAKPGRFPFLTDKRGKMIRASEHQCLEHCQPWSSTPYRSISGDIVMDSV